MVVMVVWVVVRSVLLWKWGRISGEVEAEMGKHHRKWGRVRRGERKAKGSDVVAGEIKT